MKSIVTHNNYNIVYEESFWTGKKSLTINEEKLQALSKTTFSSSDGRQFILNGNFLIGITLQIENETIQVVSKIKWYEVLFAIIIAVFFISWGNVPSLVKIVPLVGGAIGGMIAGLSAILYLYFSKLVKPVWMKILIFIASFGIAFLLCYLVALLFIN